MFMKSKTKEAPLSKETETDLNETNLSDEEIVQQPLPEKTFISNDIVVTGDVVSEGELRIEGVIKGNVRSFIIIIGEEGRIEGDLIGDSVTVLGNVAGNIRGVEVNLCEGCEVHGNILHEKLRIENGAVFEGQIRRVNGQLADAPEVPMPPKQAAKSNIEPIVQSTGLAPKKAAKKTSSSSSDQNPVIVKDVAMIVSSDNNSKK